MSYGVFKKGGWRCIMLFPTKEKAEDAIKGKEYPFEVRKIIATTTKKGGK